MSLPQPPKQLSYTLPDGGNVCFDHHLRRCDICTVDFTYEDELGYYGSDGANESNEEDRVFILSGSTARFTPLSFGSVHQHYCSTCHLTWLEGSAGKDAVKNHPSHHSSSHLYAGTRRSLLVFTDGACSANGTLTARGGVGVYFGTGSKYNISERLAGSGTPTNQKAELEAVARAMETVRTKVLPDRRDAVVATPGSHNPRAVSDVMHMGLIIVTDSSYIVECMCKHYENWNENKQGVLVNTEGRPVTNSDAFLRLKSEVEKLSMVGVQVSYYQVPREQNQKADRLAKESLLVSY